ncbi:MAG: hypothetical protein WAK01_08365 [Methylocystis sp.]
MAEKNLRELLVQHERELAQRLNMHEAIVQALKAELRETHSIIDQLALQKSSITFGATKTAIDVIRQITTGESDLSPSFEKMTIKQLILRALRMKSPESLSPTELQSFIKEAFQRDVDAGSIRPQLTRLREQGAVVQDPEAVGRWGLTTAAVLFDHPSSWPENE